MTPPTAYEKEALVRILGGVLDKPSIFEDMTEQHQVAVLNTALEQCRLRSRDAYKGKKEGRFGTFEYYKAMADHNLAISDSIIVKRALCRVGERA